MELIDPRLFVVRKGEFLDVDLGVNQMCKIDYQKRFPVIQIGVAALCSGFCARSLLSCRKLHWSRFEHWPFFPLVTGTLSSFNATQALSPLDHCSCFDFPVSGVKVSKSKFSDLYSSSPSFSIFDDWASISFDESPSRTTLILF